MAMEKTITAFDDSSSHIKSIVASCVWTPWICFGYTVCCRDNLYAPHIGAHTIRSKRTERNRNTSFFLRYILAVIRRDELPMAIATFKKQRVEVLCDFFFFYTFSPLTLHASPWVPYGESKSQKSTSDLLWFLWATKCITLSFLQFSFIFFPSHLLFWHLWIIHNESQSLSTYRSEWFSVYVWIWALSTRVLEHTKELSTLIYKHFNDK